MRLELAGDRGEAVANVHEAGAGRDGADIESCPVVPHFDAEDTVVGQVHDAPEMDAAVKGGG
jgi:hypothetical protein